MLLAIDVGNTETKLGCFAIDGDELLHSWRITTDARRTADELGAICAQLLATVDFRPLDVQAVVVASVVPAMDQTLEHTCARFFRCTPVFLKAHRQSIIPVMTERPGELGADLVAAAIGGKVLFGVPLIVISYGTATVFMAISQEGQYLGVAIAPGINTSIDALVGRAAKLPQISLEAPRRAIGTDTISALQSGIVYGFVGQTEALVARIRKEMGTPARVIATGGMAEIVASQTRTIDEVHPHLSLIGLQRFFVESA